MGVSAQSIYNWERKKAAPRKEQLAALVAFRSLGKREVSARPKAQKAILARNAAAGPDAKHSMRFIVSDTFPGFPARIALALRQASKFESRSGHAMSASPAAPKLHI